MNTNKKISDLSIESLKAAVYDHLANIEQSQAIIKAINQELASRKEQPVQEKGSGTDVPSPEEVKEETKE